jgi:hypothetical protein
MPGDATICQSGKTRKAFFQMTCVISRATPKITAEAGSTCASDAPWRGDGHSGQQRPCVPSGICRRPCSNTKQPPLLFPSRLRARPTLRKPPSRSGSPQAASGRGQISGWKARATFIRVHSCPFVVQRHPCVSFASSRLRVRPTAWKTPSPQRQSAGSQLQRADLGLESPSCV